MRVRRSHVNINILRDKSTSRRGFTLVEVIVVLTIIAILAAVGVVSLVGYINKSRFDENSRNAVTVYQAAQNGIAAKVSGGTADAWIRDILSIKGIDPDSVASTQGLSNVNDSYHLPEKLALTYNPRSSGSEDSALYDLLTPYFYDPSVFSGTMAIELDISITRDADGNTFCSANVVTAYYSKQNTGDSGWDSKCTDSGPAGSLPKTDYTYRSTKSFVGYFDGTEASITGPVSIPVEMLDEVYVFEVRNGETLDITWGFFNDSSHDAKFDIILHPEGDDDADDVTLSIDERELLYASGSTQQLSFTPGQLLPNNACLTSTEPVYDYVVSQSGYFNAPKREKLEGYAQVKVDGVAYVFPLTVTKVTQDNRNVIPTENQQDNGYVTYTISIDCMMTRTSYTSTNSRQLLTSSRLFGDSNPHNVSAYLTGGTTSGVVLEDSYATRAENDPIYFEEVRIQNEQMRYCYNQSGIRAGGDEDGKCVFNTMFGDLQCVDTDGSTTINGSYCGSSGGTAVITSYRHLSNIRMVPNVAVSFKIARSLNWFYLPVDGEQHLSEVKVYSSTANDTYVAHSPVEGGALKVVSFPALNKLYASQSLSSLSHVTTEGEEVIYSINRVQLRNSSFINNTDYGYGLICENFGTVYNIYTDNLNLVLVNKPDGTDLDYYNGTNVTSICPSSTVTIDYNGGARPLSHESKFKKAVGGLIAYNHGTVGLAVDEGLNTISMSNSVVMSSKYWSIYHDVNKAPVGSAIGRNEGNVYGLLKLNGSFAVVGRDMCGGLIGFTGNDIGARFIVDGNSTGTSDFVLPVESRNNGQHLSCVIACENVCGGAIGVVGHKEYPNANNPYMVKFTNEQVDVNNDIYTIDVTLPTNSMLITVRGYEDESLGGAIGHIYKATGDLLAIRVDNYGRILSCNTAFNEVTNNDSRHYLNINHYCGGAIGLDCESTIATVVTDVNNHTGTRIGNHLDTQGPSSAGGAYGGIRTSSAAVTNRIINVENAGVIVGRGMKTTNDDSGNGVGGAIGSLFNGSSINLDINVNNTSGSSIIATKRHASGVIGWCASTSNGQITVNNYGNIYVPAEGETDSYVGGAIALNNANLNLNITSTLYSGGSIYGQNYVGGVIGRNYKPVTGTFVSNTYSAISGVKYVAGVIGYNENTFSGAITSTVSGSITATGDYASGAIGYNSNTISNTTTTVSISGSLTGVNYTGGVVGYNNGSISNTNTTVTVDGSIAGQTYVGGDIGWNEKGISGTFNTTVNGTITGSGNYVGGAFGFNKASISNSVTVTVAGAITGVNHVGGVIGRNEKAISGTYTVTVSGTVSGGECIGGLIGSKAVEAISGTYTAVVDGSISGTQYIGGGIGYNDYGVSGTISTTVAGSVTGTGNCVGGTMGFNTATVAASITNNVSGTISGVDYVGGTVGRNNKILAAITSTVTGNISGGTDIGGVIGHNEYNNNNNAITGDINVEISGNVTGTGNNVAGVIGFTYATLSKPINATVSGNISGAERVGGIIGYNYKAISCPMTINLNGNVTGTTSVGGAVAYTTANMTGTITVTFGTAYPVNGATCVGGVIGLIVNGTVDSIVVNGTGGTVNLTTPSRTYRNSILVSGGGSYIGGIIGAVGTGGASTTATVKNISVSDVGLCVTSTENSSGLGGWIGACYGTIGASNAYVTYDVNTVKCVYSRGNSHGGFCGIASYKTGTTRSQIYAHVHMTLSNAAIVGTSEIGGVFGQMDGTDYRGEMTVSLMSNTRIGDAAGSITADGTMYTDGCFCIEAGGAVGYISHNSTVTGGKIAVEFWDTSKVFAGGNTRYNAIPLLNAAGVGGAFGSIGNSNPDNTGAKSTKPELGSSSYNISVLSPSSSPCVCSNVSHAGGIVGMVYTGIIRYSYSTAVVCNNINSGSDNYTGGAIGCLQIGYVQYCYVGGHTVGGQYVTGENNVIGRNAVGGFVGYMGKDTYVDHCYSTASVRGLDYVGGFLGYSLCDHWLQQGEVNNCYCTGRVTGNSTSTAGSFAGYVNVRNSMANLSAANRNKVLKFINLINPGMRMIANITDTASELDNCCEYADAGGPGNGGNNKINVDGGRYTAYAYDGYLAGSGTASTYPLRAFINNTHYGDWPLQPGNVNIANASTSVEIASPSYPYNGSVVTIPSGELTVALNGTLTEGRDYYVDYVNNDHAGVATVRIFGIGNYTGMITREFTIDPANIESIEFTSIVNVPEEGYCYTSAEITPGVTVTYGDITLTEGTDYELSYENNVNAGTEATVTISGMGNYTGTVSRTFTIDTVDLSYATIEITDEGPFLYAGEAINPNIVVTENGRELIKDTDYLVEYVDCDGPNQTGTIRITAVSDSNYVTGTGAFIEFEIGAQTYTVGFYDAENGNLISESTDVEYGSTVTAPENDPTADGLEFVAWYSEGEAFNFETQVTRDIIIYATWQEVNQNQGENPDDQNGNGENNTGDQTDTDGQNDTNDQNTSGDSQEQNDNQNTQGDNQEQNDPNNEGTGD